MYLNCRPLCTHFHWFFVSALSMPYPLLDVSVGFIWARQRKSSPVLLPFPLHAFLLPSVTFLLLLCPSSGDLTGISLGNGLRFGVQVVPQRIQIVAWEPGNSRKEQGMKKTRDTRKTTDGFQWCCQKIQHEALCVNPISGFKPCGRPCSLRVAN